MTVLPYTYSVAVDIFSSQLGICSQGLQTVSVGAHLRAHRRGVLGTQLLNEAMDEPLPLADSRQGCAQVIVQLLTALNPRLQSSLR